jgi:hypothetical protein
MPDGFDARRATPEELITVGNGGSLARAIALSALRERNVCTPEALALARGGPETAETHDDAIAIALAADYVLSCGVWDAEVVARLRPLVPGYYAVTIGRNGVRALCAMGARDGTILDDLRAQAEASALAGTSIDLDWVARVVAECDLGRDIDALLAYVAASPSPVIRLAVLGAAIERGDQSLMEYAAGMPEYSDTLLVGTLQELLSRCDGSWGDRCEALPADGSGAIAPLPADGSGFFVTPLQPAPPTPPLNQP